MTAPRKPAKKGGGGGHDGGGGLRWMLTYSDMITLLLALFVVLYALSETQLVHYEEVVSALTQSFNGKSLLGHSLGPSLAPGLSGMTSHGTEAQQQRQLSHLAAELQQAVNHAGLQQEVNIVPESIGVRVSVAANLLFPLGQAAIQPTAAQLLHQVGHLLTTVPNPIEVVGNTDSTPIHTARFPSNWQLGAMRAANVTQLLLASPGLQPNRVMQVSFSKYAPAASNATVAGRRQNRRVDIIVLRKSVGQVAFTAAKPTF